MKIYAAPLQGLTDAPFRHWHNAIYGGVDAYFAPFLRVERGEVRRRDLRDLTSELNAGIEVVPQAIFRNIEELELIADTVADAGFRRLDLNMGCPFPPQLKRGRGAAAICNPDLIDSVADFINSRKEMEFSVKMRPGVNSFDEWKSVLPALNRMRLEFVTVHPRIAMQGYSGEINKECFDEMTAKIEHPLIYNGNILHPDHLSVLTDSGVHGVMIGRGLIARPSMITEYKSGEQWPVQQRLSALGRLHCALVEELTKSFTGGDGQILSHLRGYWEYVDPEFPARVAKPLLKSNSVAAYLRSAAELGQNPLLKN